MKQYLIDTDTCIYYLKGLYEIDKKMEQVGIKNCFICEITIAELKYGVENSDSKRKEENRNIINGFISSMPKMPIINGLDIYAIEKVRLRRAGTPVDQFDLLIASCAVANNMVLVTRNQKHFERIDSIAIENWADNQ